MRAPALMLVLVLTAVPSAPAQVHSQLPANRPQLPGDLSCPVGFSARRQSPTEIVVVGDHAPQQHRSGQGVHISLKAPSTAIASADIVVHAASDKGRYLPAQEQEAHPDLSRSFHLAGSGSAGLHSSDLWLDHAGSILSVDLLSFTYADGSTWTHNAGSVCHAPISGYMLIDSGETALGSPR